MEKSEVLDLHQLNMMLDAGEEYRKLYRVEFGYVDFSLLYINTTIY